MVERKICVVLPDELGDDWGVEYEVSIDNITATLVKKFDFDELDFRNSYNTHKPVSDRLEEFNIFTNNLEIVWGRYYLIELRNPSANVFRVDIADALGIDERRIRVVIPHKLYVIESRC